MTANPSDNSYDQVPYPNWTHRESHPRHLEAIATLFGMRPAPITECRILEIGCAAGWNLIPMAEGLPGSEFVGIDLSTTQIAAARTLAADAGLENVRLEHADILDVDTSWGHFDYIICHGIYSWVPQPVREKIFDICKNNLAADGVALVSYNVYPGWHFRSMIRDMMIYHASGNSDPQTQIAQARAVLDFLAENCPQDSAYATILKDELETISEGPDAQLFHEHLERINHPVYFHQFAAQAEAVGLQYLGDVQFSRMLAKFLPEKAKDALADLSIIQQEQYMDFLRNRAFRRTLLCHADVALERNLQADIMRGFHFAMAMELGPGLIDLDSDDPVSFRLGEMKLASGEPIVKAVVKQLAEHWPEALSFDDLHTTALKALPRDKRARYSSKSNGKGPASKKTLASSLMMFLGAGLVDAWVHPPQSLSRLQERPIASRVARLQARQGGSASNGRHQQVALDDTERHLIAILDGEHDREALIESLHDAFASGAMVIKAEGEAVQEVSSERLSAIVDKTLERLRHAALLVS
jgi:methyltransferase-like protein/2-polyprenyl-3-methyl-5-hydroxy-6-metoxy-1,4-benzoquinol methylase